MKNLLLLSLFTISIFVNTIDAQNNDFQINSQIYYGGVYYDEIFSFVEDGENGFVAVGKTKYKFAVSKPDFWIVKTDEIGDLVWEKTIGHSDSSEIAYDIVPTNDNGYIIVGEQYVDQNLGEGWEAIVIKIDEEGNQIWLKKYGEGTDNADVFKNIEPTNDGGFIIAGNTRSFNAQFLDAWLYKIDADGNEQWKTLFGEEGYEVFYNVYQTNDNGYIACGFTDSNFGNGDWDYYLVKTDTDGNMLWENTYGNETKNRAYDLLPLQNGNYLISGSYFDDASGRYNINLIEIEESNGNVIWEQTYQDTTDCRQPVTAIETSNNCILLTYTSSFIKDPPFVRSDLRIVKINQEHEIVADTTFGGTGDEKINCIKYIGDNSYLLAGATTSDGAGFSDAWWVKITDLTAPPVNIETQNKNDQINIYPNPSNGIFTLENLTGFSNLLGLEITNITGKTIYTREHVPLNAPLQINISNHPKGIYFLKLYGNNNRLLKSQKIIKY